MILDGNAYVSPPRTVLFSSSFLTLVISLLPPNIQLPFKTCINALSALIHPNQHSYNLSPRKSAIRMASNLRLLVILFGFSILISVSGVPVTRTRSMQGFYEGHRVSEVSLLENMERIWEGQNMEGRIDVELNDYPGSGANNRHTPIPIPH